jgi:feruloyl esterase
MRTTRDWLMLGVLAAGGVMSSQGASAAQSCADLSKPGLFPHTTVRSAAVVPADGKKGLPAYCEVTALISPVPGSQITAVYRLPENWNGKMLGLGGGGWAGYLGVPSPPSGPGRGADLGLPRGYATAQTDGGHPSTDVLDVSWIRNNPVAVEDFSHRAIHEMTVLGKRVVASYYGRAAAKSYYQGCSTGGRMGMMETQRYPEDYDGVVAGAPVYSLLVQSSNVYRDQIFKAPGAAISEEQMKLVEKAVLAECDAADGLADGVVTDPRRCNWDPKSLQCKSGSASASCLMPPQVEALNKAYRTVRTSTGIVGNYGLARGSESWWNPLVPTIPGPRHPLNGDLGHLIPLMFGASGFDPTKFDIEKQQAAIHRTPFAAEYEAASTDLSKFFGRGGKLLLWHGFNDPGPSPFATVDYYERAVKANGPSNLRLFVLPGVQHCMFGSGADTFDPLTAMEQWVENGKAPEIMIAKHDYQNVRFERPVCAWPKLPYYRSGDPDSASSFECR